jgi:GMP synthase-like glutamine amidotransferase
VGGLIPYAAEMRGSLVAVLVICASACGGGAAPGGSGSGGTASGVAAGLPDRIFVYRVTDTPVLPEEGSEVVDYDPASGDARDRSGIGTATRELVVVHGPEAVQIDWGDPAGTDTILTTGSPAFVRWNRPASVAWLLDDYLRHRLHQQGEHIVVTHTGGHLTLTTRTGTGSVSLTVLRVLTPTPSLSNHLFAIHPDHVTERVRQLRPVASGKALPGAFWLGPAWKGRALRWASVDAPVRITKPGEVTYSFTYGGGAIEVTSGLPAPGIGRLLTQTRIFGKPHPCTLADGATARVYQFANLPSSPGLSSADAAQMARYRMRRVVSAGLDASIFASVQLLPSLTATCHALRPFAGR